MAAPIRTLEQQVLGMRKRWPEFEAAATPFNTMAWFGPLIGIARAYRIMIEYGPVPALEGSPLLSRIPLVRVLSPALEPQWNAKEEAPLPHAFFDRDDIRLSPLCLFDPAEDEWSPADLIADTTVPWTIDWLACYEGWLATGRWHGGGRHPPRAAEEAA